MNERQTSKIYNILVITLLNEAKEEIWLRRVYGVSGVTIFCNSEVHKSEMDTFERTENEEAWHADISTSN